MSEPAARVLVVTGAAGGMGRACARRLGARGVLLLTDVAAEPLEQTARELRDEGLRLETQLCDVSDEAAVRKLADRTHGLGPLGGIAHTAGISPTMAGWRRILEVDLIGTARLLRAFLPLAQTDSAVVCISSMAGHLAGAPLADHAPALDDPLREDLIERVAKVIEAAPSDEARAGLAYGLAKYGVIRLCQREAPAWGARGARLVSLSPGIIRTPMGQQEFERQPMMAVLVERTPLKRMGTPEEIASAVDFLLSADASFISGCDLLVDGGVTGVMRTQTGGAP